MMLFPRKSNSVIVRVLY